MGDFECIRGKNKILLKSTVQKKKKKKIPPTYRGPEKQFWQDALMVDTVHFTNTCIFVIVFAPTRVGLFLQAFSQKLFPLLKDTWTTSSLLFHEVKWK